MADQQKKNTLYIPVIKKEGDLWIVPLKTVTVALLWDYCLSCEDLNLDFNVIAVFTDEETFRQTVKISLENVGLFQLTSCAELPSLVSSSVLPSVWTSDSTTVVSGLCSVLRYLLKRSASPVTKKLLGFRNACLSQCAEVSLWTSFCEVSLLKTIEDVLDGSFTKHKSVEVPEDLLKFEMHMAQPIRMHNMYKTIHKMQRDSTKGKSQNIDNNEGLQHVFAEACEMTLADVMLFPLIFIYFQYYHNINFHDQLNLVSHWFKMLTQSHLGYCLRRLQISFSISDIQCVNILCCDIPKSSLYKKDPTRYKPRHRIFTVQEDIERVLQIADNCHLSPQYSSCRLMELHNQDASSTSTFCEGQILDWDVLPTGVSPKDGNLPDSRLKRKCEQIQSLVHLVLKLAKPGDVIVDFCSGGGHVGIVLAYMLPDCRIIMVENKEESLKRAKFRVQQLGLTNVAFYQTNLDYFQGNFNIGVALHACGTATDLVMQRCVTHRATFVCTPCCYGSVSPNHILEYPRSTVFQNSGFTIKHYLTLGHSADQTHEAANPKTQQGQQCMALVDFDRLLFAEEAGYKVELHKLHPESCTPKHHLLIGVPNEKL